MSLSATAKADPVPIDVVSRAAKSPLKPLTSDEKNTAAKAAEKLTKVLPHAQVVVLKRKRNEEPLEGLCAFLLDLVDVL